MKQKKQSKKDSVHLKKKAIFMDRDGVINENMKKITTPEQFILLQGVSDAIKSVNNSEYLAIIITNQPNIAKGFLTFDDMESIHNKMNNQLEEEGAHIDTIYMCPHHPEKGFPGEITELKVDCKCRKPEPGMLFQAKKDYNINLKESWMIGDSKSDIAAGKKAGTKTIFLTSGGGCKSEKDRELQGMKPDFVKKDLKEAVDFILGKEKQK